MSRKNKGSECWGCVNSDVIDDGYQYSLKCMKTSKRGKTIDWHMHTAKFGNGTFVPTSEGEIMRCLSRNRSVPKWCPKRKGEYNVRN